jgi:hypothetical protein
MSCHCHGPRTGVNSLPHRLPPPPALPEGRAGYSAHQAARKEAARSGSVFSWAHVKGTPPGGVSAKTTSHRRRVQPGAAHRAAHLIHNASANALVAHLPGGIEVLHLFSGAFMPRDGFC